MNRSKSILLLLIISTAICFWASTEISKNNAILFTTSERIVEADALTDEGRELLSERMKKREKRMDIIQYAVGGLIPFLGLGIGYCLKDINRKGSNQSLLDNA